LRGARFELNRSARALSHVAERDLDILAINAADEALAAVIANLGSFREASRFTTWASKFALREARRRAWRQRDVSFDLERRT
jgi:hypothetical protein